MIDVLANSMKVAPEVGLKMLRVIQKMPDVWQGSGAIIKVGYVVLRSITFCVCGRPSVEESGRIRDETRNPHSRKE